MTRLGCLALVAACASRAAASAEDTAAAAMAAEGPPRAVAPLRVPALDALPPCARLVATSPAPALEALAPDPARRVEPQSPGGVRVDFDPAGALVTSPQRGAAPVTLVTLPPGGRRLPAVDPLRAPSALPSPLGLDLVGPPVRLLPDLVALHLPDQRLVLARAGAAPACARAPDPARDELLPGAAATDDGRRVLFATARDDVTTLHLVDVGAGEQRAVGSTAGVEAVAMRAVSGADRFVARVRWRRGVEAVFVVEADGAARRVTDDLAPGALRVSPTGQRVLVTGR